MHNGALASIFNFKAGHSAHRDALSGWTCGTARQGLGFRENSVSGAEAYDTDPYPAACTVSFNLTFSLCLLRRWACRTARWGRTWRWRTFRTR